MCCLIAINNEQMIQKKAKICLYVYRYQSMTVFIICTKVTLNIRSHRDDKKKYKEK